MYLDINQIRKAIAESPKRATINRAIHHQNRLKFHAQTEVSAYTSLPISDFLAMVKNILPHDKFKVFQTLFRYPVATNEIAATCFDKLSRIFDGRNAVYAYQFNSSETEADWERYRTEKLREPQIWATKGWEFFKTEINSVLIVDLPAEQDKGDRLPQPYFYWLPIESVLAYDVNRETGRMDYIIFRQRDERIAVIDGSSYRIFKAKGNEIVDTPEIESRHDLGYCPAKFFWSEPINLKDPDVKASPLTKELEALDKWLFFHLSKEYADIAGAYPIYSGYEQACDFSNSETGDYCDGGFLKNRQGTYLLDQNGLLMPCPKCGNKRTVGPGSFVEVPVPQDGQPDLRNPVQILNVDVNSLKYNAEKDEKTRLQIITSVVGQNEEVTQREAFNEQQVKAAFESQTTVLGRIKKGFEQAQQFVDETVCRLRYGNDFVSATIDYGTEFFLTDETQLRERYKSAKEAGASQSELDALQNKIIETEYRNNPELLKRMQILADLEPYRHLSNSEVLSLYERGLIDESDLRVKLNFNALINRFERENTNIVTFGNQMPSYDNKIKVINEKLRDYANESRVDGKGSDGADTRNVPSASE